MPVESLSYGHSPPEAMNDVVRSSVCEIVTDGMSMDDYIDGTLVNATVR